MRRTFRPRYVSFAGTYQCNLACVFRQTDGQRTDIVRRDLGAAEQVEMMQGKV